jgi:hypothetical protein
MLEGSVTNMVNAFSRAASGVIEWINKNQKIVKIAAASALAIIGIGAALFTLGSFAAAASFAVGGLASIFSFIGASIGVIVSAVGMLFTPLGLVVAAIAALGGYFLYSTGIAGRAIEYMGTVFDVLKAEILAAFGAIPSVYSPLRLIKESRFHISSDSSNANSFQRHSIRRSARSESVIF